MVQLLIALKAGLALFWGWLVKAGIAAALREIVLGGLLDLAREAVAVAGATDLSDAEKRALALDRLKRYARDKGIAAGDSLLNLAIELAVSELKQ